MGNQKMNVKKLAVIASVIAILIGIIALIGRIDAKYTNQKETEQLVSAKEFYFTSNLLTEKGSQYKLNSNSKSISFTLQNNFDELRFSEEDIEYTVTVEMKNPQSGEQLPKLLKNGEAEAEGSNLKTGKLSKQAISKETITLTNLIKGKEYVVTAVGKAGYEKTLTATFTVADNEENVYKYLDTSNQDYVLLTIWTENAAGQATIQFNQNGLIPDQTDAVMQGIINYAEGTYGAIQFTDKSNFSQTYASHTYRFFVDDANDLNINQFVVTFVNGNINYEVKQATP